MVKRNELFSEAKNILITNNLLPEVVASKLAKLAVDIADPENNNDVCNEIPPFCDDVTNYRYCNIFSVKMHGTTFSLHRI